MVDSPSKPRRFSSTGAVEPIPEIDSRQLLGADRRLRIRHAGQVYELRETRFGKLILTK